MTRNSRPIVLACIPELRSNFQRTLGAPAKVGVNEDGLTFTDVV